MPQVFKPKANTLSWLIMAGIVVVLLAVALFGIVYEHSANATRVDLVRDQPVPFSHKHHVGDDGIDCRYCHSSVETSAVAGVPPTETCMTCHSELWTSAAMLAPVRRSLSANAPIRWTRVHDLPDYVYFDHSIHIAKGVGCTTCHGEVETMPLMRKAHTLTMGWCLDCHRAPEKYLRPLDRVFATDWSPPPDQITQGVRLVQAYHIEVDHLADCSVCHR
ncbi:MAG: cytochrome c3 family protein [Methylobacteriaceae bacterium]|nr:cytochrome c3 family protein [Methylobacteriaceae bacterium]